MANERIKEEAKATTEQVAEAIESALPTAAEEKIAIHKEKVSQKYTWVPIY